MLILSDESWDIKFYYLFEALSIEQFWSGCTSVFEVLINADF